MPEKDTSLMLQDVRKMRPEMYEILQWIDLLQEGDRREVTARGEDNSGSLR